MTLLTTRDALARALCRFRDDETEEREHHVGHSYGAPFPCPPCVDEAAYLLASGAVVDAATPFIAVPSGAAYSLDGIDGRWLARVSFTESCWRWTGVLDRAGYGMFSVDKHTTAFAHRFGYEMLVGAIPDGMQLDHRCHEADSCAGGDTCPHRSCVNPAHLEPVSGQENTHRSNATSGINARKTHCDNNHEFTPENTYVYKSGARACRACRRIWARQRRGTE